jgi:hypothetical protein
VTADETTDQMLWQDKFIYGWQRNVARHGASAGRCARRWSCHVAAAFTAVTRALRQ